MSGRSVTYASTVFGLHKPGRTRTAHTTERVRYTLALLLLILFSKIRCVDNCGS